MEDRSVIALFVCQMVLVFLFWLLVTGYWGYVVTIIRHILEG